MVDISVIILTYNEDKHIERCIKKVKPIAKEIFVIDSFSNDDTVQISKRCGAKVLQNKWNNNYAEQFNWALSNTPITTKWVLRLDADEYLNPKLIEEINNNISELSNDITGVVFKRRHIFLEKWIKRGVYPVKLLRLFVYKKGVCENRWMDEHIQLLEGTSVEFKHDFVDHNLNNLSWWIQKHNGYAIREAVDLLDIELNLLGKTNSSINLTEQAMEKRKKKYKYAKKPLFWRSFAYFFYRYFYKLGFLEGKEAFLWHFFQGWWYRTLVDAKVWEIKKECGTNNQKIINYLKDNHNIEI